MQSITRKANSWFEQRKRGAFCLAPVAGFAGLVVACSAPTADPSASEFGTIESAVISGQDDRLDVFEHPDASWRDLARQSTVALMSATRLDTSNPNDVVVSGSPTAGLCPDQRFVDQIAAAGCSGTLIDDDLVLTAGHCITEETCADTAIVFNFRQQDATTRATLTSDDVFYCSDLVVRRDIPEDDVDPLDQAIIRLDRPVGSTHAPAAVHAAVQELSLGTGLTLIGHPAGLPTKVVPSGEVVRQGAEFSDLGTSLDTQGGSSGAGVFDDQQRLVAVHTHGVGVDSLVQQDDCLVWNSVEQLDVTGVRYAFFAVLELCALTDHPLCGSGNPLCGDGVCEPVEQASGCSADCPELPLLPWEALDATVDVNTDWADGYCAQVDITNESTHARPWEVRIQLNESMVTDAWQAEHQVDGSILRLTPPSWQPTLAPGASTNAGFCASRTDPAVTPELQFATLR